MTSGSTKAFIKRVIKKHGSVIDLRTDPEILISILLEVGVRIADGDVCGGVPPSPAPPPGPSRAGRPVDNEDVLRAVLKVSREVTVLRNQIRSSAKR